MNLRSPFVSMLAILAWSLATANVAQAADDVPLDRLVSEVKSALLIVQKTAAKESLPTLDKAELEVNVVQKTEAGGKITFLVFEFGKTVTNSVTHSIKLTLGPPPADAAANVAPASIADSLAASIAAGTQAIAVAQKGAPPLYPKNLDVSLKFAVARDGNGKLTIKYPPFELEGGKKISGEMVQSITLSFKY